MRVHHINNQKGFYYRWHILLVALPPWILVGDAYLYVNHYLTAKSLPDKFRETR